MTFTSQLSACKVLPNVICCGGSWMVTEQLVRAGDWDVIEALAREAMQDSPDC